MVSLTVTFSFFVKTSLRFKAKQWPNRPTRLTESPSELVLVNTEKPVYAQKPQISIERSPNWLVIEDIIKLVCAYPWSAHSFLVLPKIYTACNIYVQCPVEWQIIADWMLRCWNGFSIMAATDWSGDQNNPESRRGRGKETLIEHSSCNY